LYKDWWAEALAVYGIDLVAVPVAGSSETSQAADVLCQKDIQAIGQIMDNTTRPGFIHLARKAEDHGIPVFGFDSTQVKSGAVIALSRDFFDSGVEAGAKAIRVLHGERPADIPFSTTQTERLIINESQARSFHLHISPDLLKKATRWEKGK
jgi:putative ABC transport system substrate-binding protein